MFGVSVLVILVTTSVLTLTGCVSHSGNPPPSGNPVDIHDFNFNPQDISIQVGDNVRWTNNGAVSHTVTSNGTEPIDSPLLSPGQTYTVTFTAVGPYPCHRSIHPLLMWGTVTVT